MEQATGPSRSREERLEGLVKEYQRMLLKICYVSLKDQDLARDAVQETFLKAYKSMEGFRGESSEKTWLIRIALNTCQSMKRGGWFRRIDRRMTPEDLPLAAGERDEEAIDVMAAVMNLPRGHREAVTLYYWQHMTVQEIAQTLGVAQSTVSSWLKQARERLRTALEGRDQA